MDWFGCSLHVVVLTVFVLMLRRILFQPTGNKIQHAIIHDDLTDKNKVDERVYDESLLINSSLNYQKLKDLEALKFIETTRTYETEEYYETCDDTLSKNNDKKKIDESNVKECSGYGSSENEIQNHWTNSSDEHIKECHSLLKIYPRTYIPKENSNSIIVSGVCANGNEVDLQKFNVESTEDEGNESEMEDNHEELKKKTFFSERKHKIKKIFNQIEKFDVDYTENKLREMNTSRLVNCFNSINYGGNSSDHKSEEENNSKIQIYNDRITSEIPNKDTKLHYDFESQKLSDPENLSLSGFSDISLPSSINDNLFQNIQDTKFTFDYESQKFSDRSSLSSFGFSCSTLPSSINDNSFQNIQDTKFSFDYGSQKLSDRGSLSSSGFSCSTSPSSLNDNSFQNMLYEGNCEESFFNSTTSDNILDNAFIEDDISQEY